VEEAKEKGGVFAKIKIKIRNIETPAVVVYAGFLAISCRLKLRSGRERVHVDEN